MKKCLWALLAVVLAAASCVKETPEVLTMEGKMISLTATVEQPAATRTVIAGDSQVFWEPGDEIKVFAGTASGRFVSDLSSVAATATFTGSLDGTRAEGAPLWAVYPYSEAAVLEGEALTAILPAEQIARPQSFAKGMNLSVARTTTASLQFYNVGGGVCFTLKEDGIQKVVFEGLNGEILAGKVKLAFQEDRPVIQEVFDGSTTVTLAAPEGKTLEADGVWYYIVALPGTLEKGFKLSFFKGNTVAQKTFSKTVTIKRSIYGEVRNADEGATYVPDTDENISFKDAKVKEIVVRYFDTGKNGELSYKEAAAVRSFLVDEALTRTDGEKVSVFAGTGIKSFDEIKYFTGLTKIEDGVFAGCTELTAITIPANITEIGANAFKGCTSLQSITVLSQTPPTIGADAFADTNNCPILVPAGTTGTYTAAWGEYAPRIEGSQPDNEIWYTSSDGQVVTPYASNVFGATIVSNEYKEGKGIITFDGPVTAIGERAFNSCRTLSGISIPSKVETIGAYAFFHCYPLVDITIPGSVTQIGNNAFDTCYFEQITIPSSVTKLGDGVFQYCRKLKSISIPESVIEIGTRVFEYTDVLSSITVAAGNNYYDSRENCNALIHTASNTLMAGCVNTVIPASVEKIGPYAFARCAALSSITIPMAVTAIGDRAFSGCSGLTSVTLPPTLKTLGSYAFEHCSGLTSITLSSALTKISDHVFFYCSALSSVEIPSSVTEIGAQAFCYCRSLARLTLPASVTKIEDNAFGATEDLSSITVAAENRYFDSRDNCNAIIHSSSNSLVVGCKNTVIPSSVTGIGAYAFFECSGLVSVTIPAAVTKIQRSAFANCSGLSGITLPNTLTTLDDEVFRSCTRLKSVAIPPKVTYIGYYAFWSCTSLTEVTIPAAVEYIGNYAFQSCRALDHITVQREMPPQIESWTFEDTNNCLFYVPAGSEGAYRAAWYWRDYASRIQPIP